MKKQILLRGLLGVPIGISAGYIITIIISLLLLDGEYSPVVSTLTNQFGNEINAVIFQTALFAVMGFAQSAATLVWDIDGWGVMKQAGTHFFIISVTMLPIAYFSHWINRSFINFAVFFGIIACTFLIIWLVMHCVWKHKIKKINEKLNSRK